MNTIAHGRLDGIESLRAYAAVAIIFFHLVGVGGTAIPESLGFISSHFGFGVPLFFVVSGFSLAYGYDGKLGTQEAVEHYFWRRFARIAPLFYCVLAFQLVNVWYENGIRYSVSDILLNLAFVFNFVPHLTEGIVPASWTIGVEMVFYLLFPFLLMACTNAARTAVVLVLATGLATKFSMDMKPVVEQVPSFVYHNFITQLPYFMWGMLCRHLYGAFSRTSAGRYSGWAVCALGVVGILALYHSSTLYQYFWVRDMRTTWDTLWGIPFGMLCIGLALHPTRVLSNRVTRYLGKVSYSLYLVHPTVLYKLGQAGFYKWIYEFFPGQRGVAYFACLVISLLIITAISTLTFRFIEKPGMDWGKRKTRPAPPRAALPDVAVVPR